MGKTKSEKLVGIWIGNEASVVETALPEECGLLDLARLVASRVLRGVAAGADRFFFELESATFQLWECLNSTAQTGVLPEPDATLPLVGLWQKHDQLHEEHRLVPDTPAWLMVRGDADKAWVAVRFDEHEAAASLAEVVAVAAYHLILNGARTILVELDCLTCLVMTADGVDQAAVERSCDETVSPENYPLTHLLRS